MKKRVFVFFMLLFTLGLNAQNLSGDWRVTPLTSKSFILNRLFWTMMSSCPKS